MLAIVNLQRPVPYLYLGLGGRLVDIGGLHIPTLGSAAATFGAVYATFARFDRVQSRNNRRFVSRWLKGLTLPRDETWNDFFLELFTYLFGPRHLLLRCAVTSVLLSIFLVTLILAVTGFLSQETVVVKYGLWMPLIITPEDKRRIAVYLVVVGCVCDYLSLWKTRFLLTRVRSASFARLLCLAFGDFAATTLLYLLVRVAIITMVELYRGGMVTTLSVVVTIIFTFSEFVNRQAMYLLALLTSAWLWVYMMVAAALRLLSYVPVVVRKLSKVMDMDEHPVRSIGYIAAALSALWVLI